MNDFREVRLERSLTSWSQELPDLSPLDIFVLGFLKFAVHEPKFEIAVEIKKHIIQKICLFYEYSSIQKIRRLFVIWYARFGERFVVLQTVHI